MKPSVFVYSATVRGRGAMAQIIEDGRFPHVVFILIDFPPWGGCVRKVHAVRPIDALKTAMTLVKERERR